MVLPTVNSDYQIVIEKVVTGGRYFHDSLTIRFLRHCAGGDLADISEEKRLENTLAMMEMRDKKMPVKERLRWLLYNPVFFLNDLSQ